MEIPHWTINQLNIFDLGTTIQVSGVIYADSEVVYLCMMPDEPLEEREVRVLDLNQEDWKKLIRQTDLMEVEVFENAPSGSLAKIIVRKSTRQIEQGISWSVFRRDGYRCRYCGKDGIPLTVDHLVLWEDGGPSIEKNLVTSCRKCNKSRGNMQYKEWLGSPYYKRVSANLDPLEERKNWEILKSGILDTIPLRAHTRGR